MILGDKQIKKYIKEGKLVIKPFKEDIVRENGLDLHLGGTIGRFKKESGVIDPLGEDDLSRHYDIVEGDEFIIEPHESILIHTIEYIEMPTDIVGLINLRSSYARIGISIPPTIVDAGFKGELTIQLTNGSLPVKLYKGERIIHLILVKLHDSVERAYQGVYSGQRGIQIPIFKNLEKIPDPNLSSLNLFLNLLRKIMRSPNWLRHSIYFHFINDLNSRL